jgi:hypothetical protein
MTENTDRRDATAPDLYVMFGLSRRPATDAPARFNASRALQQLPAVAAPEDLWRLGFRSHALYPTTFGSGGWR